MMMLIERGNVTFALKFLSQLNSNIQLTNNEGL